MLLKKKEKLSIFCENLHSNMHIDWKTGGQTYAPYLRIFSFQIKIFLERVVLEIFILLFLLEKERKKISLSKPDHTKKIKPFQAGSYKRKEKNVKKENLEK